MFPAAGKWCPMRVLADKRLSPNPRVCSIRSRIQNSLPLLGDPTQKGVGFHSHFKLSFLVSNHESWGPGVHAALKLQNKWFFVPKHSFWYRGALQNATMRAGEQGLMPSLDSRTLFVWTSTLSGTGSALQKATMRTHSFCILLLSGLPPQNAIMRGRPSLAKTGKPFIAKLWVLMAKLVQLRNFFSWRLLIVPFNTIFEKGSNQEKRPNVCNQGSRNMFLSAALQLS